MLEGISFNKPYFSGNELIYIQQVINQSKISGNGEFTKRCHHYFETKYGFKKCLLTTSCTDALEMAAILLNLKPGDEIILPSYTFVSTANAFLLRGAQLVFADSRLDHPGMDEQSIEALVTPKTKAIVVVHYAGVACDMDVVMDVANRHGLFVVEDAAQAVDSFYKGKPLGGIGHLAAFSFHETKNIHSGEGGMLVVNDERFIKRAEIIWEKGTNRSSFFRGEVDKYSWVDIGSSFLPSEIIAAFLYAQLENLELIQQKRKQVWNSYAAGLENLEREKGIKLPFVPSYATNNAHMFYLVCKSLLQRTRLIEALKRQEIQAVFHYLSLHNSEYYLRNHRETERECPNADGFSDSLVRLPFYCDLTNSEIASIVSIVKDLTG